MKPTEAAYRWAVKADPNFPPAWHNLADLHGVGEVRHLVGAIDDWKGPCGVLEIEVLSEIKSEHSARNAPISPALVCRSITAMGSALPVLVQSGNLSLEIWSSGGCRLKNSAAINAAFELMLTGFISGMRARSA